MIKSDVRIKLRQIMQENETEESLKTRFKKRWLAFLTLAQVMKGTKEKLVKMRKYQKERQHKMRLALNVITKAVKFRKLKGSTFQDRLVLDIRM